MKTYVLLALALTAVTGHAVNFLPLEYEVYADWGQSDNLGSGSGPTGITQLNGTTHNSFEVLTRGGVNLSRDNVAHWSGVRLNFLNSGNTVLVNGRGRIEIAYRFQAVSSGLVPSRITLRTAPPASFLVPTTFEGWIKDLTEPATLWNTTTNVIEQNFSFQMTGGHVYEVYAFEAGSNTGLQNKGWNGRADIEIGNPVPEPATFLIFAPALLATRRGRK